MMRVIVTEAINTIVVFVVAITYHLWHPTSDPSNYLIDQKRGVNRRLIILTFLVFRIRSVVLWW